MEQPKYPYLENMDLQRQVEELEDYIRNLHKYTRYALTHIDQTNMTRAYNTKLDTKVIDLHPTDGSIFGGKLEFDSENATFYDVNGDAVARIGLDAMVQAPYTQYLSIRTYGNNELWINGKKYVGLVESGTNNGWYYRKYSDGFFECWKRANASVTGTIHTAGNMYYTDTLGWTLPLTPTSILSATGTTDHLAYVCNTSLSGSTLNFRIGAAYSLPLETYVVNLYVSGTYSI